MVTVIRDTDGVVVGDVDGVDGDTDRFTEVSADSADSEARLDFGDKSDYWLIFSGDQISIIRKIV